MLSRLYAGDDDARFVVVGGRTGHRPGRGLSAEERRRLERAVAVIREWLAPIVDGDSIEQIVMPMLEVTASRAAGDSAGYRAQGWLIGLAGLPLNAVAEAVKAVLDGTATIVVEGRVRQLDPHWQPTPGEIARLARDRAAERQWLAGWGGLVLEAPELAPPPPPDPEATAAGLAELSRWAALKAHRDSAPPADGGHFRRVAEDLAARRKMREGEGEEDKRRGAPEARQGSEKAESNTGGEARP